MFSTLMPMIMMSKGGLGSDSTNSLLPLLLMSMGKYRGCYALMSQPSSNPYFHLNLTNRISASDGGDSKMSSMLPMMMMMSPQGSGSNPMLPMILGMMGKSHAR